jgi:hypothetical protein
VKPSPRHDFPVCVSTEQDEHPIELAGYYRQIFDVQLNYSVSLYVVPNFAREPWPPRMREESVTDELDARRSIIAAARYAVTPDDLRANSLETFTDLDGGNHTLFYISTSEHERLVAELERLSTRSGSAFDATPVSQLDAPVLQRLLLDRIVPSGAMAPYIMALLGR